MGKHISTEPHF